LQKVDPIQLVIAINKQASQTIKNGGDKALLPSLHDIMGDLKKILDSCNEREMNAYCQQYKGFGRCMLLLETMAIGISDGSITVPE